MIAATFSKESGSYRPCNEINQEGGHLCESPILLRIDVNGLKGPNTLGRDVFEFIVGEDGIVYPNYGKEQSIYYGNPEYYWKNNDYYCSKSKNSSGLGCAGRVIEGDGLLIYSKTFKNLLSNNFLYMIINLNVTEIIIVQIIIIE